MHNAARYALGAFAGAAIISGVGIGVAMAGDSGPSTTIEQRSGPTAVTLKEGQVDDFLARLAARLGVDEQTLRDAIEETLGEEVQKAADDGVISQELADRLRRHIENGSWADPLGPEGLFDWLPSPLLPEDEVESPLELLPEIADIENDVAEFMGASEEELREALADGDTLGEVAEQFGVSREELQQFLLEKALEVINDERVPEGFRDMLRSGLNQLIELYIDGELSFDDIFNGGIFAQP